jgi:RNA polymerase sigma-70 factor (ECF subfamily)
MTPADRHQFLSLVQRVQEGSPEAAQELYNEFAGLVLQFVRRSLGKAPQLRTLFDSSDFRQDVFASFFTRVLPRRSFESPEEMAAFLRGMVDKKVLAARRKWLDRAKRSLARQAPLAASCTAGKELGREADTAEQVAVADAVEHVGPARPDAVGSLLSLWILGHSPGQIARQLGTPVRAVNQTLHRVKDFLENAVASRQD